MSKALDIVGDRWTLPLVRNLLLGPQRFTELKRSLGMTPNQLSKRLRENEALGLIEKTPMRPGLPTMMYQLTPLGEALEPVIHALGRWGQHRMGTPDPDDRLSLEWLLIALRRRYKGGVTLRAELVADGNPYYILLSETEADIGRGRARPADLRIKGPEMAIAQLFLKPFSEELLDEVLILGIDPQIDLLLDSFYKNETPPEAPADDQHLDEESLSEELIDEDVAA